MEDLEDILLAEGEHQPDREFLTRVLALTKNNNRLRRSPVEVEHFLGRIETEEISFDVYAAYLDDGAIYNRKPNFAVPLPIKRIVFYLSETQTLLDSDLQNAASRRVLERYDWSKTDSGAVEIFYDKKNPIKKRHALPDGFLAELTEMLRRYIYSPASTK